jgi:hypothetical protein
MHTEKMIVEILNDLYVKKSLRIFQLIEVCDIISLQDDVNKVVLIELLETKKKLIAEIKSIEQVFYLLFNGRKHTVLVKSEKCFEKEIKETREEVVSYF